MKLDSNLEIELSISNIVIDIVDIVDIVTNVKMIDNKILFNKGLNIEVGFGPERGFILCLVSRWLNF